MNTEQIFSKRLKELRKANGISQTELSKKLMIGRSTLAEYEAGRISPTIAVAAAIARFFNVSTDYLLGLTDDPTPCKSELPKHIKKTLKEYEKLKEKYEKLSQTIKKLAASLDD